MEFTFNRTTKALVTYIVQCSHAYSLHLRRCSASSASFTMKAALSSFVFLSFCTCPESNLNLLSDAVHSPAAIQCHIAISLFPLFRRLFSMYLGFMLAMIEPVMYCSSGRSPT